MIVSVGLRGKDNKNLKAKVSKTFYEKDVFLQNFVPKIVSLGEQMYDNNDMKLEL